MSCRNHRIVQQDSQRKNFTRRMNCRKRMPAGTGVHQNQASCSSGLDILLEFSTVLNSLHQEQVYHDALCSLEKNPMAGVVSPPVMGGTGVVPLSIVAPLPDLCRHLANCIVRAKHEIFLGTNFWIHSDAATLVTNAIRELSKRAGQEGRKVIMKMVYDRGDPRQVGFLLKLLQSLSARLISAIGLGESVECF